jgi:hypothetical protein
MLQFCFLTDFFGRFPMQDFYDNPEEELLQTSIIKSLAAQLHRPIDEVRGVYEGEIVRLKSTAKVKTFLHVIAERYAREKILASPH